MSKSAKSSTAAAVQRCREAYHEARDRFIEENGGPEEASEYLAEQKAAEAFRNALPPLSSRQNVIDFIACVARGVLVEAIPDNTSSRLIYAALAVLRALPPEPKAEKIKETDPRGAQIVNRVVPISNESKQNELAQKM
jgi:hypothetical protein